MGHRQRQRTVATGTDTKPAIGFFRQRVFTRINHDQFRAALHGPADALCVGRFRHLRVYPPEQDRLRAVQLDPRRRRAIGELGAEGAVPGTDMSGGEIIRAAEQAGETFKPGAHVFCRRPCRRGAAEDNGLGPAFGFDPGQPVGDGTERLVPGDRLPARIGIALGPGTLHRLAQPVRRVDHFGRRGPLHTDAAIGMIGVGRDLREDVIFDRRDHAAA